MKEKASFPVRFVIGNQKICTELPVTSEEYITLKSLPPCEDGQEKDLRKQIPSKLYTKIKATASKVLREWIILENFKEGRYNLDVLRWFQKDLDDEVFCEHVPGEKSIFIDKNTGNVYLRDDEELFELWQDYEHGLVEEKGVEYLKEKYGDEIDFQTDISKIKWTLEF